MGLGTDPLGLGWGLLKPKTAQKAYEQRVKLVEKEARALNKASWIWLKKLLGICKVMGAKKKYTYDGPTNMKVVEHLVSMHEANDIVDNVATLLNPDEWKGYAVKTGASKVGEFMFYDDK